MLFDQMHLLILVLVLFVVLNAFVLRLSCRLTNYVSRWFPQCRRLTIPRYRTCLLIVCGVLVIMGLIASASEFFIASWFSNLFPKSVWNVMVALAEILLLFKLIAWGLSDEQREPTRLVSIASFLHLVLAGTMCFASGQLLHGLIVS